ncbi:hypothetical protein HOY80DRAFT_955431 [Tuber brumale]|nr:hypothetical protein HOY80DRAFT_955431 [Tuber brumale]
MQRNIKATVLWGAAPLPLFLGHSSCHGPKKPSCYGRLILDTCSTLWNVMPMGNTRVQRNLWHNCLTISRYSAGTALECETVKNAARSTAVPVFQFYSSTLLLEDFFYYDSTVR